MEKKITAKVTWITYERMREGPEVRGKRTYIGERHKVLQKIANEHSYGADESDTAEHILESILNQNGDGCDLILSFELDGEMIIECEDEPEEVVEC